MRFKNPLKNLLILSASIFALTVHGAEKSFPFGKTEKLKYNVYYQWGLIWKKAAEATLSTQETIFQSNKALHLKMAARTTSFFDNFLKVRDTMSCITTPQLQPIYFSKMTHEGKFHGKEDSQYKYANGKTSTRLRTSRDNIQNNDTTFFHNGTPVFDMLSVFYYIRSLDVANLKPNQTFPLVIVSGNRPYNIKVIYNGEDRTETPGDKEYNTYKITLIFEYMKGKKMEKEEMHFWMSRDEQRIPIHFSVKLPLGSMKAYFQGVE